MSGLGFYVGVISRLFTRGTMEIEEDDDRSMGIPRNRPCPRLSLLSSFELFTLFFLEGT